MELADLQIKEFSDLVEKKLRSSETLKQWKATKNKIAESLLYQYKINDMELGDVNYSFAQDFLTFLTVKRIPAVGEAYKNNLSFLLYLTYGPFSRRSFPFI
ncbi:phage integrase SAM-like domain-containing protein [Pedobacter sp. PAMC26386]|nr:phage integrase SAM-like domain-containing protein [Pedobacter sp. PAMC26386]